MPVPRGTKKDATTIARLKEDYLGFFKDCPVQKYGAQYIGRDEQTIIDWKNADPAFRDAVLKAEADFLRKRLLRTQASFQLERLFKDLFAERKEVTGKDGKDLGFILGVEEVTGPDADSNGRAEDA